MKDEPVAILSETTSRRLNVHLAELALLRLGAKAFHVVMPTPPQTAPVPIRSTGASVALGGNAAVLAALGRVGMVVDLTVEGLMHAAELPAILEGGARVLYVSNEHPDILERLAPDPALKPKVRRAVELLRAAKEMRVTSAAGTDLSIRVEKAPSGGGWGVVEKPGQIDHWPGGIVVCFPRADGVNGTLVMDTGDINLTFKRYLERPVRLRIEDDFVTAVEGDGVDAALMRRTFEVWDDRNAYAVSHVGWGMNPSARWDALAMYDRGDVNGTEQRAFAGNFLYSTGANEHAGRHTLGHFDLPLRNCTIALDGREIVKDGVLQGELV
jgi:2,5-dihydroxypyridine 5,6-dioxygenase